MTVMRCRIRGSIGALLAVLLPAIVPAAASEAPLALAVQDPSLAWGPCPEVFPAGCEIAVLHGNPAEPGADIFFRVPANYAIPRHWHTSAERMVLVSGEMAVTYDGHDAVVLTPGMYAYGPPAAPHTAQCRDAGPCVLFIAFVGPVDVHTDPAAE